MKQSKMRYSFKKTISIIYILVFFFTLVAIWIEQTETILISYGLIGAGIAVALQDVFKNFVGGIIIFTTGAYKVGDRIEITSKIGDVMDIGLFYTTIMEIGEWIDGNQATGRITTIPNGTILTSNINNYTKDHNFIWDEITIPITYNSDWKKAIQSILQIVRKETDDMAINAEREIEKLGEKYYLPKKPVDPHVFITLHSELIELRTRYVTDAKERRIIRDTIGKMILEEFEQIDSINITSGPTDINVNTFPDVFHHNK